MAEAWITYQQLAAALGISTQAARQKAIRQHWRRQRGNDGKALVLVDLEAAKASHVARDVQPSVQADVQEYERRTVEALDAHIVTLKEMVAKAEATGEQHRTEAVDLRKRLDKAVADLADMAKLMADHASSRERLVAELEAYRARPWWKRIAG